jgi:hypothetical protein
MVELYHSSSLISRLNLENEPLFYESVAQFLMLRDFVEDGMCFNLTH